jgi:hypothetical protein
MAEGERATGTPNTIYDLFRPFFLCYDAADRRFFRRPFVSSFPFPEGPLQCRAKGRMYSPLSCSGPSVYLAAPGVDRHHYLITGAGVLSGGRHTHLAPLL